MDICDTKPMEMSSPNVSGSRINADITLELVSDPVPMGLCDTEQIEISSLNAVSGKNIDIPLELSIETTPPILEVTDMKSNVDCAESKSHSNNKLAPSFNAKLGYKTSASSNSQFVPKISRGRHELNRFKNISPRKNIMTTLHCYITLIKMTLYEDFCRNKEVKP
ncbi:uncharacterized protein LOC125226539 [Leguminivora glycinivorella]|uniref:uncharacterized protein LOC125226539 n=1 Tax=Leguminivora glycinivorella TaxID=1035111 RepID=UPI00200E9534|nr:uncharacterized protein LOC125226539 [Leguminivora glycinivorella]